jgi:hypothetical protein
MAINDTLNAIGRKLDTHGEKLGDIGESIARIEAVCPTCQDRIKHIETAVGGNGAGLRSRVARLEEAKRATRTQLEDTRRIGSIRLAAICAVVAAIGTLIGLAL